MRTRRLNKKRVQPKGRYVLCWLQQALRGNDNAIIDVAVHIGNALERPVVVYHGIDNRYQYASHRLHRFILEASQSLEAQCQQRRLRFCRYVRRPEAMLEGLVYRLAEQACCIVTDEMPTFVAHRQARSVANRVTIPLFAVDAACAVPMSVFDSLIASTAAFRSAHTKQRERFLDAPGDIQTRVRKYTGKLCFEHDDLNRFGAKRLERLIAACAVDMSLPPASAHHGSQASAQQRLKRAIQQVVPRYRWTRNNPSLDISTSELSPYLHFGVLGPREIVSKVQQADLHPSAAWKFLDEMLTWREYYHHLAWHSKTPDGYENVPQWARDSLARHQNDARPYLYDLATLLHGTTHDDTWNVAQRQFLLDGWMHNNLRMYWVKQIIQWTPTPENAWQTACYLNDRLSLDGRDPSTYGGIQWGFGRSRKAYKETDIYGWVPRKTDAALRRRPGVSEWIAAQTRRPSISVAL